MVANTQRHEDLLLTLEQIKMEISKQEMRLSQKLDIDLFDEEIQIMRGAVNARVSTPATGHGEDINPLIVTNKRGSQGPPRTDAGGRGVRMSVADKTKLKDMQEQLERISTTQKKVETQLRKINIDEFRNKLDDMEK